jgi:hypothetical protein
MSDALAIAVLAIFAALCFVWEKMLSAIEHTDNVWYDHLPRSSMLVKYANQFGKDRSYYSFRVLQVLLFAAGLALLIETLYGR